MAVEGSGLSALGTVLQRVVKRRSNHVRLTHHERTLLQHVLQEGLTEPDFFAVRRIGEMAQWSSPALLSLLLCERLATAEGSTFLNLTPGALDRRLLRLGLSEHDREAVTAMVPTLPQKARLLFDETPDRNKPFVLTQDGLYRQTFYVSEQRVNAAFAALSQRPWRHWSELDAALRFVTEEAPLGTRPLDDPTRLSLRLAPEQSLAALLAVHAPFTLIAGGPGTGKTSIVTTILRLLWRLGVDPAEIALAAPTGRAANRMGEALRTNLASVADEITSPSPRTLHRLLAYAPSRRRFRHNAAYPLEASWVIVDEASMIDLAMMEQLVSSLKEGAHLILLGDADQLPSVDAGAVFRDLTQHQYEPLSPHETPQSRLSQIAAAPEGSAQRHLVTLQQTHRQADDTGGRAILAAARAVREGDVGELFEGEDPLRRLDQDAELPWSGTALLEPSQIRLEALVRQLFQKIFQAEVAGAPYRETAGRWQDAEDPDAVLQALFDVVDRLRVLAVTRYQTNLINRLFGQRYATKPGRQDQGFAPGLPWMVTRNDYRQGLFNGDVGLSLVDPDGVETLYFRTPEGHRRVPFARQVGLEPAFALTVHKSQGSECGHVVLVLPAEVNALCKREVIYTALTRAKRSVLIYGESKVLETAVQQSMTRDTGACVFNGC